MYNKPLKILIVSQCSYSSGGKARFTQTITDVLKKNEKLEVRLLETTRSGSSAVFSTLSVFAKLFRIFKIFWKINTDKIRFIFLMLGYHPDIVQIHTSSFFDFFDNSIYILLSLPFKVRRVIRIGGGGFAMFYSKGFGIIKKYKHFILKKVNVLVCQSEYWKEFFISVGVKRPEEIQVIPNFIDYNYWQKAQPSDSTKVSTNILYIPGRELGVKGFFYTIPVLKELVNEQNVKVTLVGNFEGTGFCLDNNIEKEKIIVLDYVSGKEKLNLFKNADVFLLPSYFEGFPNSILEAMAAGIPIVTTNIPSIKSLFNDNINALLITPGNKTELKEAIKRLISEKEFVKEMIERNKKLCYEKYDKTKINGYFEKLYNV